MTNAQELKYKAAMAAAEGLVKKPDQAARELDMKAARELVIEAYRKPVAK
jgi:hypothetical protein